MPLHWVTTGHICKWCGQNLLRANTTSECPVLPGERRLKTVGCHRAPVQTASVLTIIAAEEAKAETGNGPAEWTQSGNNGPPGSSRFLLCFSIGIIVGLLFG